MRKTEEQIQRLCICIKEIKRKGKSPSVVSDAVGKVDTKSLQVTHKCNSTNTVQTHGAGWLQTSEVKPKI